MLMVTIEMIPLPGLAADQTAFEVVLRIEALTEADFNAEFVSRLAIGTQEQYPGYRVAWAEATVAGEVVRLVLPEPEMAN